eukprot:TRINITY_DN11231_c0_g1_i3.p1 TRINITY_DN11231_c0_g1~~TRINITY_DN11231_c0_g1_i3.p1  ORF type:complete len:263 (+),score=39.01 TRINITY_DN11231_c0_g1_i3:160-948(+)
MCIRDRDRILLWLSNNHNAEISAIQLGAGKAGVELQSIQPANQQQLTDLLQNSNCKALIFSPNTLLNEKKYSEVIANTIPELQQFGYGKEIKIKNFPNLKYIVHTGFYSQQGIYKFKEILTYASKNYNSLSFPKLNGNEILINYKNSKFTLSKLIENMIESSKKLSIQKDDVNIIASNPQNPRSFQFGVLNSLIQGNYSLYMGNLGIEDLQKIIRFYKQVNLFIDSSTKINLEKLWTEDQLRVIKQIQICLLYTSPSPRDQA